MATLLKTGRLLASAMWLAVLSAILFAMGAAARPQSAAITITLAGQSMIRSDIARDRAGGRAGDPGPAEGRCDVHQPGIRGRRKRRDGP